MWIAGTYTAKYPHVDGKGKGVHREDGTILVELDNPTYVAVVDSERCLAVCETSPHGKLVLFDVGNGTVLAEGVTGEDACHVSVSPSGELAAVAAYSGGQVELWRVGATTLTRLAAVAHTGATRVNPDRQEAAHPHCAAFSPSGRFVAAADLGCDSVTVYAVSESGMEEVQRIAMPPGSGPRHVAWVGKEDDRLVAVTELDNSLALLSRAGGADWVVKHILALAASSPPTDKAREIGTYAAAVRTTANGKFAVVSLRYADEIVVVSTEWGEDSVHASVVQRTSAGVACPRDIALSPDEATIVVLGQDSDDALSFGFDPDHGRLSTEPTGARRAVPSGVSLAFLR